MQKGNLTREDIVGCDAAVSKAETAGCEPTNRVGHNGASITDYMTEEQKNAYGFAAGLSAANEPDREAWAGGVAALRSAEEKAINGFRGEVKLNRHGQPYGGIHPALVGLTDYFDLSGCYAGA